MRYILSISTTKILFKRLVIILLLKSLFEIFYGSDLKDNIKKISLLDIGEHIYKDNFVVDHEINFYCCVFSLENTLKTKT